MNKITSLAEVAPIDHHAAALAHITQVVSDLDEARAIIGQLRADLHREQDRVTMLVDALDKSRFAELNLRQALIEIATQQDNISLLCEKAKEIVAMVRERDSMPAPESDALIMLEKEFDNGNVGCGQ